MARKKTPTPAPPAPPTPMTRADVERITMSWLENQVQRLENDVAGWKERFAKAVEPARVVHELDWSLSFFEAASKLMVYKYVLEALTKAGTKATIESVYEYATKEAISKARFLSRSSSPTSNLTNHCTAAAWAQLSEDMQGWVASLKSATTNAEGM